MSVTLPRGLRSRVETSMRIGGFFSSAGWRYGDRRDRSGSRNLTTQRTMTLDDHGQWAAHDEPNASAQATSLEPHDIPPLRPLLPFSSLARGPGTAQVASSSSARTGCLGGTADLTGRNGAGVAGRGSSAGPAPCPGWQAPDRRADSPGATNKTSTFRQKLVLIIAARGFRPGEASASIQTEAKAKSLVKLMHKQKASTLMHERSECVSALSAWTNRDRGEACLS